MNLIRSAIAIVLVVCVLSIVDVTYAQSKFRGMTASSDTIQDYTDLRNFGANLIAFQIARGDGTTEPTDDQYNAFLAAKLNLLDQVVSVAEANGMKVLVILFSPPGGMNTTVSPQQHRLFAGSNYTTQFVAAWQAIATRYKGRSGIYGYDLLNEPAVGQVGPGVALWNTLSQQALTAIRAIDSSVQVIIEPPYGNPDFLNKLTRITDTNLAYSFHSYFTSAFRNQGLNGRPINVPYPKVNKKDPKKGFNRLSLLKSVSKANTFQRLRKGTRIISGEFAAPRWAPNGSAARYIRDSIAIFERFKWDWANHAWREADVWSPEHSNNPNDSAPSLTETDRAKVLKSFFRKNKFS
jgi:aryl-phospho-beta-D-glucosidase BglC (GH1 family)